MAYIRIPGKYPYTLSDLRRDNPQTSFPNRPDADVLAPFGVFAVQSVPQPSHDPTTQNIAEGFPTLEGGVWLQVWVVADASAEEVAERKAQQLAVARRSRQQEYIKEADPLFFKWQAGEGTAEEWKARREEIRARYPYPEE